MVKNDSINQNRNFCFTPNFDRDMENIQKVVTQDIGLNCVLKSSPGNEDRKLLTQKHRYEKN